MVITQEQLKELLSYDPGTGLFTWLVSNSNVVKVGDVAGSLEVHGYVCIKINKAKHKAHRLAWLYVTGSFPTNQLDHINRIRNDNRWRNLRLATSAENQANVGKRSDNTSGYKGVSWHKGHSKWQARCQSGSKRHHIGLFDTAEAAYEAYQAFATVRHGEFFNCGVTV